MQWNVYGISAPREDSRRMFFHSHLLQLRQNLCGFGCHLSDV